MCFIRTGDSRDLIELDLDSRYEFDLSVTYPGGDNLNKKKRAEGEGEGDWRERNASTVKNEYAPVLIMRVPVIHD